MAANIVPAYHICCIGAGCAGVCFMASIAFHCPAVVRITILDQDLPLIQQWNNYPNPPQPVYEPGLQQRLLPLMQNNRVQFLYIKTIGARLRLRDANIIFVCTGVPIRKFAEGREYYDLANWEKAYRRIAKSIRARPQVNPRIIVDKTTAPMEALDRINYVLDEQPMPPHYALVFNPELFSEGTALQDIDNPTKVFLGCPPPPPPPAPNNHLIGLTMIRNLYNTWINNNLLQPNNNLNFRSLHMAKIARNMLLTSQITIVNTISSLCTSEGVDCREVMNTVPGFQERYLDFGIGFGGPGLIKETKYATYLATKYGKRAEANVLRDILQMNMQAKKRFVTLIMDTLGTIQNKRITIFGFAHKANTNDCRESPAIDICKMLIKNGAVLTVHDPFVHQDKIIAAIGVALYNRHKFTVQNVAPPLANTVAETEAICILTDHPQYIAEITGSFVNLGAAMRAGRRHHIFDGRNTDINWVPINAVFEVHLGGG